MTDRKVTVNERATQLRVDEIRALDHFCHLLEASFGERPYLVGSAITRPDYRDVDVRVPLDDEAYEAIPLEVLDLNMLLSQWGQRVSGLPIDCQVQRLSEFQAATGPVNPRGLIR